MTAVMRIFASVILLEVQALQHPEQHDKSSKSSLGRATHLHRTRPLSRLHRNSSSTIAGRFETIDERFARQYLTPEGDDELSTLGDIIEGTTKHAVTTRKEERKVFRPQGNPRPEDEFQVRVMTWNILAHTLADDGFLMRMETLEFQEYWKEFFLPGKASDYVQRTVPMQGTYKHPDKYVSMPVTFKQMVYDMTEAARVNTYIREHFKKVYYDDVEFAKANERAVLLDIDKRLTRVVAWVDALKPDIIALQEVDKFKEIEELLCNVGKDEDKETCTYTSFVGSLEEIDSTPYVKLIDRTIEAEVVEEDEDEKPEPPSYVQLLEKTTRAFAPKYGSNAISVAVRNYLRDKKKLGGSRTEAEQKFWDFMMHPDWKNFHGVKSVQKLSKIIRDIRQRHQRKLPLEEGNYDYLHKLGKIAGANPIEDEESELNQLTDEEVGEFYDTIETIIKDNSWDDEGAAIFWNSNVFEPVEISEGKSLEFQVFDEKQASVKIKLKHKTKGTVYTVVTTHLSSGDAPVNQWERNQQIAELYKLFIDKEKFAEASNALKFENPSPENEELKEFMSTKAKYIQDYAVGLTNPKEWGKATVPKESNLENKGMDALTIAKYWFEKWSEPNIILAMDANSPPTQAAHKDHLMKSFSSWFGGKENSGVFNEEYMDRITVNKCRGPGSDQVRKIGLYNLAMIDYVYTSINDVKLVYELPQLRKLDTSATYNKYPRGDPEEHFVAEDGSEELVEVELWKLQPSILPKVISGILPSLSVPSDHHPVVVDIIGKDPDITE